MQNTEFDDILVSKMLIFFIFWISPTSYRPWSTSILGITEINTGTSDPLAFLSHDYDKVTFTDSKFFFLFIYFLVLYWWIGLSLLITHIFFLVMWFRILSTLLIVNFYVAIMTLNRYSTWLVIAYLFRGYCCLSIISPFL